MKIVTLIENDKLDLPGLKSEHGVCLYIESDNSKILLDLGKNNKFLSNAKILGVDLSKIDAAVISHGHYDHGGGIKRFLKNNSGAKILLKKSAFDKHYVGVLGLKFNCGLSAKLLEKYKERFVLLEDDYKISKEVTIVTNIQKNHEVPKTNKNILMRKDNMYVQDDFSHELILLVRTDKNLVAISGCGHSGILNIVDSVSPKLKEGEKLYVITGMHLDNPVGVKKRQDTSDIEKIAEHLASLTFIEKIYTGHCTGEEPYRILKETLGDKLDRFTTGKVIIID